jgi:Zn-finger nucleic acid-binding protein
MECLSCQTQIDPKWRHAIELNTCPFCGQHIIDERLQDLLTALAGMMEEAKDFSTQVEDWLLSNHGYIKTNSPNLHKYLPKEQLASYSKELAEKEFLERKNGKRIIKVKTENGEQDVEVEQIQSDERTASFHQRAQANKGGNGEKFENVSEKTRHLKNLMKKIKSEGGELLTADGQIIGGSGQYENSQEMNEELYAAVASGEDEMIRSSLPTIEENGMEKVPSVVLNMAKMAGVRNQGKDPSDDLRRLEEMRAKAQRSGFGGNFSRG